MFAATAVLMLLASPVGEIVETTRSLELGLKVIEAFEHGPVILDVTLTNRGKKPLKVRSWGLDGSRIVPPAEWKVWWPPLLCGGFGLMQDRAFEPGETWTERHRLHLDYISKFPAGTYHVEVSWSLTWSPDMNDPFWRVSMTPTKTFPVTISPATPANRWALAARLDAEFAALPLDAGGLDGPLVELGDKLINTPHKELIPLALRLMDRVRMDEAFSTHEYFRQRMAGFLFRADPVAAHRIFVDRLLANPRRADPRDVFHIWGGPAPTLARIVHSSVDRYTNLDFWLTPAWWHYLSPEYEIMSLLQWANYSAPCVLPTTELKRLATAKDFTVRAWTYSVFGERLGQKWCDDFLNEARREAQTKPDPKKPTPEDPALRYLIFYLSLHPDHPHGGRLFDAFLAGSQDNPIAKTAREELAEREKREKERKR